MWLQEVEQFSMGGGKEVVKLLVGNKVDQPRVVQREVADDWARSRGMLFMEASAKTREGIAQVFNEVVQKVSIYFFFSVEVVKPILKCFPSIFIRSLKIQHCFPTLVLLSQEVAIPSVVNQPTLPREVVVKLSDFQPNLLLQNVFVI